MLPPPPHSSIWPSVAFIFFSLSTKWMLCCYWDSGKWGCPPLRRWLQSIKWPHPTPPFPLDSLSRSPPFHAPPRSLRACKHAGFHFAEKTFCCNCCAVRFSGLQDYRLYPDTPRWTCVPLTLQSLQFCKVIYEVRRTHPPYLLLSTFMNPGVCRGPEKQSYYPSTALRWGDKSALAPFKKGGTEFSFAVVGD